MAQIDLGKVVGDPGTSMRLRDAWTANTAYVNNSQYIDIVTNGGNSYACKTSHTSGSSFSATNWAMVAQKGATGAKGDTGTVPTIKAGTVTSLDATAAPTVSASTSGTTTTFNFGIPKGDTSDIKTPTFTDTVGTYSTLTAANNAAETSSNAIKSKTNFFTILSNMKKSFSAIVQGLKILGTNVGAITGITSDLAGESDTVAASIKAVNQLNGNFEALGERKSESTSMVSDGANLGTAVWQSVCYITLPPGKWLVFGQANIINRGSASNITLYQKIIVETGANTYKDVMSDALGAIQRNIQTVGFVDLDIVRAVYLQVYSNVAGSYIYSKAITAVRIG